MSISTTPAAIVIPKTSQISPNNHIPVPKNPREKYSALGIVVLGGSA
jgi:hypothetical protein